MSRTADVIVELVKIRDNMLHISNVFSLADVTDIVLLSALKMEDQNVEDLNMQDQLLEWKMQDQNNYTE